MVKTLKKKRRYVKKKITIVNNKTRKNSNKNKKGGNFLKVTGNNSIMKKKIKDKRKQIVEEHSISEEYSNNDTEKMRRQYNEFAKELKNFWDFCSQKNNYKKSNNKLLIYYDNFLKNKNDNYIDDHKELSNLETDIYDMVKVDNHIHLSAIMTSKELKDYMKDKQVSNNLSSRDPKKNITLYKLNTIIDKKKRGDGSCADVYDFNSFNNKYYIGSIPGKEPEKRLNNLRQCFLKTNIDIDKATKKKSYKLNKINTSDEKHNIFNMGEFNCNQPHYAELTKKIAKIRNDNNTQLDLRLSIYGRSEEELQTLSDWFIDNELQNIKNINWYIQIPRIIHMLFKNDENFKTKPFEFLISWFVKIFSQFKNGLKSTNENMKKFLSCIKGFDSVDNEGEPDEKYYNNIGTEIDNSQIKKKMKENEKNNPFTFAMYLYFMRYFISDLNKQLKSNDHILFTFKPHAGELGPSHHLLTAYLLSDSICHGTNLIDIETASKYSNSKDVILNNKNGVLLELYRDDRVGCSLSPTSNNYLSRSYKCLHLDVLFNVGLLMSISTDDPLMFHMTEDPLLEELTIVKNMYNFSLVDIYELIINSHMIRNNIKYLQSYINSNKTIKSINKVLLEKRQNIRNETNNINYKQMKTSGSIKFGKKLAIPTIIGAAGIGLGVSLL